MENFEKNKDNYTPFKDKKPFDEGRSEKFEHSTPGSSMISREELVEFLARDLGIQSVDPAETAKTLKTLFEELNTKYDIPVDVKMVVAKTKHGDPQIHFLAHKIEGEPVPEKPNDDFVSSMSPEEIDRFKQEMDKLLSGLSRYALENYKKNSFLWDIAGMVQYMWGRKILDNGLPEENKHIYLVDVEPNMLGKKNSFTRISHNERYFIEDLINSINDYEKLLKIRFEAARENIERLRREGIINQNMIENLS